jgi:hypothetical protein
VRQVSVDLRAAGRLEADFEYEINAGELEVSAELGEVSEA